MYQYANTQQRPNISVIIHTGLLELNPLTQYADMRSLLEEFLPYIYHVRTEGVDDPSWMSSIIPDLEELGQMNSEYVNIEKLIEASYDFMNNLVYLLAYSGAFMISDDRYTYELEWYDERTNTARIDIV